MTEALLLDTIVCGVKVTGVTAGVRFSFGVSEFFGPERWFCLSSPNLPKGSFTTLTHAFNTVRLIY